jgi:Ca2+-binding RTX toxin-like protein
MPKSKYSTLIIFEDKNMPTINGIEFWISDDFSEAANGRSGPLIVNGRDYSKLYAIQSALVELFNNNVIRDYLTNADGDSSPTLPPKIYITEALLLKGTDNNAAWLSNASLIQKHIVISETDKFYLDLPKMIEDPANPASGLIEDPGISGVRTDAATSGYIDITRSALNHQEEMFKVPTISGTHEWVDFKRVLFHELAHGQSRAVNRTDYVAGPDDDRLFTVAENIAIDAENLVYRRAFGGIVRVGHDPAFAMESNDPTAAFFGSGKVTFKEGNYQNGVLQEGIRENGVNRAGAIRETVGNDIIEKIYGQANFVVEGSESYQLNNYELIKAHDGDNSGSGILISGTGEASILLSQALNGIAHDNVGSVIKPAALQIDEVNDIGIRFLDDASSSPFLSSLGSLLSTTRYSDIVTAVGLSSDTSVSDHVLIGPYIGNDSAKELFIAAGNEKTLLIGASGTNKTNVNFDNRTDYLKGGAADDILVAGTGSRSGKFNVLDGGAGNDLLIGRSSNDKILGGDGDDTVILSGGNDQIEGGNGNDTLVVGDSLGSVTIDLSEKENGASILHINGNNTAIQGIENYIGNDYLTKFKGAGNGDVFISGAGGGEFHLLAGDRAIGFSGAVDTFFVTTTIPDSLSSSSDAEKIEYLKRNKVFIGNFGSEDIIYVNGILFNGNKVSSSVSSSAFASDRNLDLPINSYSLSGDSSYGVNYASTRFSPRGVANNGQVWGQLEYASGQYKDVTYSATDIADLGVMTFFARSMVGINTSTGAQFSSSGGYILGDLNSSDEQLSIVIDGFQNGYGGITFQNDAVSNLRSATPGNGATSQTYDVSWQNPDQLIVGLAADVFDGLQDGYVTAGGSSFGIDDPRYNIGNLFEGGAVVDWDQYLAAPRNIQGSAADDSLQGGAVADTISGNDGNDVIVGGDGNDRLDGGAGNDLIFGGNGDDVLIGGDDDDTLFGEAGQNTIYGGSGADTAVFAGSSDDYRIYRTSITELVVEYVTGVKSAVITDVEYISFQDSDEVLLVSELPLGSALNDDLAGSVRADYLDGGLGDDIMAGGQGDDIYVVDSVGDVVSEHVSEGNDTVRTSLSNYVLGENVENLIYTEAGNFQGSGNSLDNYIAATGISVLLDGGAGDDVLSVGPGQIYIDGGVGRDVVKLQGNVTDYRYAVDTDGVYYASNQFTSVQMTNVEGIIFDDGSDYDFESLLQIYRDGTESSDSLILGDDEANHLRGFSGNDRLRGGKGNDIIDGGNGSDIAEFSGSSQAYQIYRDPSGVLIVGGVDGWDMLYEVEELQFDGESTSILVSELPAPGTSGADTIVGSAFSDRIYGLGGDDVLSGAAGDDVVYGGDGNDIIDGGSGKDHLDGGFGNDTFIASDGNDQIEDAGGDENYNYDLGNGNISIYDGGGLDTLAFGVGISASDVVVGSEGNDVVLTVLGATITIVGGLDSVNLIENIRFIDGTSWQTIDRLLAGSPGVDSIIGTTGNDVISGGAGDDIIEGALGDDTIAGDSGNDILSGSGGDDTYRFNLGDGQDVIREFGGDWARGGDGNDTVSFGAGIDPDDVTVSMSADGRSIILKIAGTLDQIILQDSAFSELFNIENISFYDGTTWHHDDLINRALTSTGGDDTLNGSFADDIISAGGGNDFLAGGAGDDILIGGTGNDYLDGGKGNDVYRFSRGDGQDVVLDDWGGNDTVEFDGTVLRADVTVTQASDGNDLVLSIAGGTDTVTLRSNMTDRDYWIEQVRFADGTVWSHAQLVQMSIANNSGNDTFYGSDDAETLVGGAGNDILHGRSGDDIVIGGTGNDYLDGGKGNDVYRFSRGDGQDIVFDDWGGNDTLEFDATVLPADVSVTQASDGQDLVLSIAGTTDRITLRGTLSNSDVRIEQVRFADGTIWNSDDLIAKSYGITSGPDTIYGNDTSETISSASGNDVIYARGGNDILIGGTGNDYLDGGKGNDVYRFSRGDGQDVVLDDWGGSDTVEFDGTIFPADVTVTQASDGNDLVLSIAGGTDTVTLRSNMTDRDYWIEQVRFADGTVWSHAQLVQMSITNNSGNDTFYGSDDAETLAGGAGNDTLHGRNGDDIVIGGIGNDYLDGGKGNDVYRFSRGDGQDVVLDDWGGSDTVEFDGTIVPADVTVTQASDGNDLVLSVAGGTDTVTLRSNMTDRDYWIEQVRFADGTVWSHAQLVQMSIANNSGNDTFYGSDDAETLAGGAGNDILHSRSGDDIVIGGTGNDYLDGGKGNDVYRFSRGDGQDIVFDDWGGNDTVEFDATVLPADVSVTQASDGQDLVLSIAGTIDRITLRGTLSNSDVRIEQVRFADGTIWNSDDLIAKSYGITSGPDTIYGNDTSETISSASGNDVIYARGGNDILIGGTGNDYLDGGKGNDVYRFSRGDGQDVVLDDWGGSDTVEFDGTVLPADVTVTQASDGNDLVLSIAGGTDTVTLRSNMTDRDYWIEQVRFADGTVWSHAQLVQMSITNSSGNDTFYGSDDAETLAGGAGNDTLHGRSGDDIIIGGMGNDYLDGGKGNDVYRFSRGDGQDVVLDDWGGNDTVEFDGTVLPADMTVTQANDGQDIVLSIAGSTDRITLRGTLSNSDVRIEQVRFADGTIWNSEDLLLKSYGITSGPDMIYGSEASENISAASGDDVVYARGGNDLLIGGTGNDYLDGGRGDDAYRFSRGDGQDVVLDNWGGNDAVEFDGTVLPADVSVIQASDGNDLVLSISGGTDTITLRSNMTDHDYWIEQVRFADGTVWNHAQLVQASLANNAGNDTFYGSDDAETLGGGAGNDNLYGRSGDDIVIGGTGNDYLDGGKGNDVYRFSRGDGQDIVLDNWGGNDTVEFDATVLSADVSVTQTNNGRDLILSIADSTDEITLRGTLVDSDLRIEQVRFADGTIWDHAALVQKSNEVIGSNLSSFANDQPDYTETGSSMIGLSTETAGISQAAARLASAMSSFDNSGGSQITFYQTNAANEILLTSPTG